MFYANESNYLPSKILLYKLILFDQIGSSNTTLEPALILGLLLKLELTIYLSKRKPVNINDQPPHTVAYYQL